jgi:putative two-component system response regulator
MTSVSAAQLQPTHAQIAIAVEQPRLCAAEDKLTQDQNQVAPQTAAEAAEAAFIDSVLGDRTRQLHKQRVLIVDSEETSLLAVQTYLQQNGYQQILSTTDARNALSVIKQHKPDVVLLDISPPSHIGLEILRGVAADAATRHLPIIVLTATNDPDVKQAALKLGATDFLNKPIDPFELIPRVRNALLIKSHKEDFAGESARLEAMVRRRTEDLSRSRQQLILGLAKAAEHRDDDTGNHVLRVGRYAGMIAKQMGWPEPRVQMLELAAQLHDVGKIGIPDSILFKPGKLDPQEWELMRKHCSFGVDIVEPVSMQDLSKLRAHARLGAEMLHVRSSPMMMMAARIAQTHHEKWDGSGYPIGLAGEDIPIEGRITAVADVFDALSSERPYKKAFPRQKCFDIIQEGRGNHFDPQVVDAFFQCASKIVEVQLALMDRK